MAWNQPGNDNKDPWGNRNRKQDGPPDLDEVWKKLSKKWGGVFGGGSSGSSSGGNAGGFLTAIVVVAVIVYGFFGLYTINESEQGVILRFGQYHRTVGSGLGWAPPMIDRVNKVNTNEMYQSMVSGVMLTKDENIVEVELGVQYRIDDPEDYLFNLTHPKDTIRQAAESAFRQVIGDSLMDNILTVGKEEIRSKTRDRMEEILSPYKAGLTIVALTFEQAIAPSAVQDAFDDAIKAREDKDRSVKLAEAYAREIEPKARGQAEKMLQDAEGYKAQVVAKAKGEVARFEQLLPQYEAAPEVTRNRLYIETMEEVFSKTSKVIIDVEGGNNMMYLPLDKIMNQRGR